jgi:hypothetical protein
MADYRVRHRVADEEGQTRTFETEDEAVAWWSISAREQPGVQAREIVLERQESDGEWIEVPTGPQ